MTEQDNWYMWFNPLFSYMASIYLYHFIHPHPPLPIEAPTFGHLTAEVVFGIVLYDLLFYPIHYALHNAPFKWFRKQHVVHHKWSSSLNAVETVQHSYIDGFLQVVVNIIVQQISPFGGGKHPLSRIIHNVVVTYLLTESHSGYDLGWQVSGEWRVTRKGEQASRGKLQVYNQREQRAQREPTWAARVTKATNLTNSPLRFTLPVPPPLPPNNINRLTTSSRECSAEHCGTRSTTLGGGDTCSSTSCT